VLDRPLVLTASMRSQPLDLVEPLGVELLFSLGAWLISLKGRPDLVDENPYSDFSRIPRGPRPSRTAPRLGRGNRFYPRTVRRTNSRTVSTLEAF
jgi:hypothetical protein